MGQERCVDCISLTHGCLLGGLCWTRFGIVGADERIMVDFRLFHRQISSNNLCGMKTLAKGHTAKIGTAFTHTNHLGHSRAHRETCCNLSPDIRSLLIDIWLMLNVGHQGPHQMMLPAGLSRTVYSNVTTVPI